MSIDVNKELAAHEAAIETEHKAAVVARQSQELYSQARNHHHESINATRTARNELNKVLDAKQNAATAEVAVEVVEKTASQQ